MRTRVDVDFVGMAEHSFISAAEAGGYKLEQRRTAKQKSPTESYHPIVVQPLLNPSSNTTRPLETCSNEDAVCSRPSHHVQQMQVLSAMLDGQQKIKVLKSTGDPEVCGILYFFM